MSALESWLAEVEARTVAAQPKGGAFADAERSSRAGKWFVRFGSPTAYPAIEVDHHVAGGAVSQFVGASFADVPRLCAELRAALGREARKDAAVAERVRWLRALGHIGWADQIEGAYRAALEEMP